MVRVKNRYLVVKFLYPSTTPSSSSKDVVPQLLQLHQPTPDAFHAGLLLRAIRDGITELFGDYGMGMASTSLKINYHSPATSTAIIRCPQAHYQMVWAALTYMTKLPKPINTPVVVQVVRVSGTIKKAEMEVIRRAKEIILRAKIEQRGGADNATGDGMVGHIVKMVERRREEQVLVRVEEGEEEDDSDE
ncbi:hypothetical protein K504DRAFT_380718 [Pleomassaria siparia CBS 279.74]|uniref:Ribonuclease P/MRP protein subunit POP5 n=1 Tax=Pleomassaria siparia CBS 279.74 TaxID=1314801 RepID=A0A6G1K953_9PLEO|nr:hypothetical protein K504DRAFT_380718 [Pleomassaria siparia CBS 279.74]